MLQAMLAELKQAFGERETIPFEAAGKLMDLLDQAPEDALVLIVQHRIKFADNLARMRLVRRFKWSNERLRHLLDSREKTQ
jgi:hypothetical protein